MHPQPCEPPVRASRDVPTPATYCQHRGDRRCSRPNIPPPGAPFIEQGRCRPWTGGRSLKARDVAEEAQAAVVVPVDPAPARRGQRWTITAVHVEIVPTDDTGKTAGQVGIDYESGILSS